MKVATLISATALLTLATTWSVHANETVENFLKKQLATALTTYDSALQRCKVMAASEQKKLQIPLETVKQLKINRSDFYAGLIYFQDRFHQSCLGSSQLELMSAMVQLASFSTQDDIQPIDPIKSGLALITPSSQLLEALADFDQMSPEKKLFFKTHFENTFPTFESIENWSEVLAHLN